MVPAKSKDFIPEVAEFIGIPEEDLSNMLSFYFKENKKQMSRFEHLSFTFRGLGKMTIKGWVILKEIEKRERSLLLSTKPENIELLKNEIALYKKANEQWIERERLKKEAKQKKRQYYIDKNIPHGSQRKATDSLEE